MPIELKDVAAYTGLELDKFKDADEFKAAFDSKFVNHSMINEDFEPVKKIAGKIYGTLENDLKKIAKEHEVDIDFESEDFKGLKKVSEKYKFVTAKIKEKDKSIIDELTVKASQGNDDKVKEWEKKYNKLESKFKDTEGLLKTTKDEYEGFKTTTTNQIKNSKMSFLKKDIYGKAKFIPEANEYTKKGFINAFEEKYKIDLDESDNPVLLDANGAKIPSKKKSGEFKSVEEALEEELTAAKLLLLNPDGGKPKPPAYIPPVNGNGQEKKGNGRQIASPLA